MHLRSLPPYALVPCCAAVAFWLLLLALGAGEMAMQPDSGSYLRAGNAFWETGRFETAPGRPEVMRTPGYALPAGLLLGPEGAGPAALQVFQLMLLLGTVLLAATLPSPASLDLKPRWRCAAGLAVALDPLLHIYTFMVMSEVLSALVLLAGVWALLAHVGRKDHDLAWLGASGLLFSLSILVRPSNVLVPLVYLVAVLACHSPLGGRRAWRWRALAVAVAMLLLPAGGWAVRNAAATGHLFLSLKSSENLLHYHGAAVLASERDVPFETVREEFRLRMDREMAGGAELWELAPLWSREAKGIFLEHPRATARMVVGSIPALVVGPGSSTWGELAGQGALPAKGLFSGLTLLHLLAIYAMAGIALAASLRRGHLPFILPCCLALFFLAVLPGLGATAYSRFRIPVMPILAAGAIMAMGLGARGADGKDTDRTRA